ncbi:glucosamine-6-phosphate deaminase [Pedococcus sp. P5_B7]
MRLIVCGQRRDVAQTAGQLLEAAIDANPELRLGLATGASPEATYQVVARISDIAARARHLRVFALDEYLGLPPSSELTYANYLARHVSHPWGLQPDQVLLPNAWTHDHNQSAENYEEQIHQAGGIDLQVLGIGANGHLAFNEPYGSLSSRTRVVRLSKSTRRANARFFPSLAQVPEYAITQGLGTISRARRLLMIATGDAKAQALSDALSGPVSARCPASILQLHADVTIVADHSASSLLPAQLAAVC